MRLYDLTEQYNDLLNLAQDGGEGVDYGAMLEGMEGAIGDKLDGYCKIVRTLEAESEALKVEALRLSQRKTTIENNIARMKEAMKGGMLRIGMDKHKSPLFSVSITKPRDRVEVTNVLAVPSDYIKQPEPQVDKKAVMDALKGGAAIPGVTMVQGESGLMIR
ncbi:siphovirus Gp157 family protein [Paenibacillus apiarius]|uniref:Siphovirus Gp157 family protein n=1 Tax=Paenibacillus apiarius TaxID=46240 RepID=A0ABT4DVI1_9BACL|nr:siphovirus Gp157 family protein [Paenibacillus apiarius]MCY9513274.1 siphovirus Gp157 family protein [Paenibacillus apiarius]MCY9521367.1 siphovirus Gp157 family protein [Paenibacillus apiarius]MCY9554487.1 siphovirus Gp157 family protein [Paenibacillus apiarius]MCY9560690.1 siphovirus Gp157 family protein [Paenibacillus apiarius]MCY9685059.1 siphovirus Gp157 family protein [Paenibacillus apiarius]